MTQVWSVQRQENSPCSWQSGAPVFRCSSPGSAANKSWSALGGAKTNKVTNFYHNDCEILQHFIAEQRGGTGQKEVKKGKETPNPLTLFRLRICKPEASPAHFAFAPLVTSHFNRAKQKVNRDIKDRINAHPSTTQRMFCSILHSLSLCSNGKHDSARSDTPWTNPPCPQEHQGKSCFCLSICERGNSLRSWKNPTFFCSNTWKNVK